LHSGKEDDEEEEREIEIYFQTLKDVKVSRVM